MSKSFEKPVNGMYGAPMGRPSDRLDCLNLFEGRVHLTYVPLYGGGCYDKGGAYWGSGQPLYCAWDNEGLAYYIRANSRKAAKAELLEINPELKFYR